MPVLDPMLEIARGMYPNITHINKFGANGSIAAGTTEDVWDGGGTYSFPTTVDITHMSQATDQVAMRGGLINIQGLDANWDLVVQQVALDASDTTTVVVLTTALRRVFRLEVYADVIADSNIEVHNVGDTTTYAIVMAGNNQTEMAIYTVPNGKTGYITRYYGDMVPSVNKDPIGTVFSLFMADRGNTHEFHLEHAQAQGANSAGVDHRFAPYKRAPQKTDIRMTAKPDDKEVAAHAGFDLILVDN